MKYLESRSYTSQLVIKILIAALVSFAFGYLAVEKIKAAGLLSAAFCISAIAWAYFERVDEKKFTLVILFIYPLLPSLWGIMLPAGIPVLKAHRIITIILIIFLIRKGLFLKYYKNFFKEKIFTIPIAFITLSMFISSILSQGKGSSIFFTLSFIFELLLLAVVIFNVFTTREDLDSLVRILCYSAIILSLFGVYEKYTEYNFFTIFGTYNPLVSLLHVTRDGAIRVYGPFGHPISFGTYFALLIPLILYRYDKAPLKLFAILPPVMLAILATQSRSAQISASLTLVLYTLLVDRKKIIFLLIFLLPAIIYFWDRVAVHIREVNPFTATDESLVGSTEERGRQFIFYLAFIRERLLFGYGLVTTPYLMRGRWDGSEGNYQNTVDNFYLLYAFYYGIVGLATWFFMMFEAFRRPIAAFKSQVLKDHLILYLLFGVLSFVLVNAVAGLWHYHFIFWIFIGMIARLIVIKKSEAHGQA